MDFENSQDRILVRAANIKTRTKNCFNKAEKLMINKQINQISLECDGNRILIEVEDIKNDVCHEKTSRKAFLSELEATREPEECSHHTPYIMPPTDSEHSTKNSTETTTLKQLRHPNRDF